MNTWLIYFVILLDSINIGLIVLLAFYIGWFVLKKISISQDYDGFYQKERFKKEYENQCKKANKLLIPVFVLFTIATFLPNTREAATIYIAPKIINNKQVKKMPDKLVTLANAWMDEKLKDIKRK